MNIDTAPPPVTDKETADGDRPIAHRAIPPIGDNAFAQALNRRGVTPFDKEWVRKFKKEARLSACPTSLARFLSRLLKNPVHMLPIMLAVLTAGALVNAPLLIAGKNGGYAPQWGQVGFFTAFALCLLGLFASDQLKFPVWKQTRLKDYREPIPEIIREFISTVDAEVKGVTWKAEKLTMTSDPFLIAEYGGETYYLKRWEETPPKND